MVGANGSEENEVLDQIRACVQALDDKKAENLKVLYMGQKSSLADYFIIGTGTSEPHLRALGNELTKQLKEMDASVLGVDAESKSGWVVVDAYDFIFHLFTQQMREFYKLDMLWKDAEEIPVEDLLGAPAR